MTARDLFTDEAPAVLAQPDSGSSATGQLATALERGIEGSNPSGSATHTTRDETPAAEVQDRQCRTGRTPDREGEERLPLSGAAADANRSAPQAPCTYDEARPEGLAHKAAPTPARSPAEVGESRTPGKSTEGDHLVPAQPAALSTCGNCAEASAWKLGFLDCAQLQPWHHMSEKATCTFLPSKWKPIDAAVIARRAAQRGIDQAAAAADSHYPDWTSRAFEFVKRFAEENRGKPYIGHDIVRASLMTDLPQPLNSKAWGQPIQRAARARIIRKTERGYAPDPNRHANPVPEWETV